MKKYIVIAIAVVLILGGVFWLSKNQRATTQSVATFSFETVKRDIQSGASLYDVRTAAEYSAGHFEGASNWPLQDMQSGKLPDVAKNTKVYVYCHSGNRSGQATAILKDAGYTNVTDLHGVSNVESLGGKLVTN